MDRYKMKFPELVLQGEIAVTSTAPQYDPALPVRVTCDSAKFPPTILVFQIQNGKQIILDVLEPKPPPLKDRIIAKLTEMFIKGLTWIAKQTKDD